jgi:hypothetical protein
MDLDLVALKVRTNFATLCCDFDEPLLCFFFHNGVLYIILVMHACVYEL